MCDYVTIKPELHIKVFCDFDGTVAQNDVGNQVFTTFGDAANWWRLVAEWQAGRIDGRSLWREQCKVSRITQQDLNLFAAQQPLDPHFPDFVEFCNQNNITITILSDGMDAYIKPILNHHGFDNLDIRANHLTIIGDGSLKVEFPYFELGCKVCANCKGYHVRNLTNDNELAIYVGNGFSDRCAIAAADVTFAKGELHHFCEQNNLPNSPFRTFADVLIGVKSLTQSRSPKQG
jgi:2-hydroxy-3-keto-5-methylthiopentenyl-1-phosphate phosphatase